MQMSLPSHGDELLPSCTPWIPHPTQEFPKTAAGTPQIAPNIHMDLGFDNYDFMFPDSPQNSWEAHGFAVPTEPLGDDGPRPCSTDADMLAAAPQAVPAGGGGHAAAACPCCATTEIQHLEETDAQRRLGSWKHSDVEQEQRLFAGVEPWTAPDEKLAPAPAPEDGCTSGRDADMPEVNKVAPQPGPLPVAVRGGDACGALDMPICRYADEHVTLCALAFVGAIEWDLSIERHKSKGRARDALDVARSTVRKMMNAWRVAVEGEWSLARYSDDLSTWTKAEAVRWSIVWIHGAHKGEKAPPARLARDEHEGFAYSCRSVRSVVAPAAGAGTTRTRTTLRRHEEDAGAGRRRQRQQVARPRVHPARAFRRW